MEIHYSIYEQVFQDERISLTTMAKNLSLARNTVASHFNYMIDNEILFNPTMRLKMFEGLREYMYYLRLEKPMRVYQELEQNPRVVYHCLTSGAFDLVVLTDAPVDFESHPNFKECLLSGARGDYYTPHISRDTYEEAFKKIEMILTKEEYSPSLIPMEFTRQTTVWSDLEWKLFYDLKYNMRRTFTEIVKKHGISKWLFYRAYEHIKENCVKIVSFYPHKRSRYSDFYFVFKADYEELLRDLFMLIPCSSMVSKVDNHVVAWINIIRTFPFKDFFGLLHWMDDNGIIDDMMYALPVYSHNRD
jgi:hypothetical protein